jgi:hypothetical protein
MLKILEITPSLYFIIVNEYCNIMEMVDVVVACENFFFENDNAVEDACNEEVEEGKEMDADDEL